MSDFLKFVGEKLRLIRKSSGLTQEELAEKAGLQSTYIGGVERGDRNISLQTFEKIINALNVTPVEVFKINELEQYENINDKKLIIEGLNNLLLDKSEKEIKMIYKIVKDLIEFNKQKYPSSD